MLAKNYDTITNILRSCDDWPIKITELFISNSAEYHEMFCEVLVNYPPSLVSIGDYARNKRLRYREYALYLMSTISCFEKFRPALKKHGFLTIAMITISECLFKDNILENLSIEFSPSLDRLDSALLFLRNMMETFNGEIAEAHPYIGVLARELLIVSVNPAHSGEKMAEMLMDHASCILENICDNNCWRIPGSILHEILPAITLCLSCNCKKMISRGVNAAKSMSYFEETRLLLNNHPDILEVLRILSTIEKDHKDSSIINDIIDDARLCLANLSV